MRWADRWNDDLHLLCVENRASFTARRTYYAWTAWTPVRTYYACAELRKQRPSAVISPGLSACLHPHY